MTSSPVPTPRVDTPDSSQPDALLFRPSHRQKSLRGRLENAPRYLFRLYAPTSAGRSDADSIVSSAATQPDGSPAGQDKGTDLLQLPWVVAANMLCSHIDWKNRADDNLVSWTTSLIFAIQHGLHRVATDWRRPDLSDVWICVVDTRDFPTGTFAKDLDLLEEYAGHESAQRLINLRRTYYFGEFLSQGHLVIQDRSCHACLGDLVACGLYDLEPRFRNKQEFLAKRVEELRGLFHPSLTRFPTSKKVVRKAITMAQVCFDDKLALIMAVALLSLQPRREKDPDILAAFGAMFTGTLVSAV